MLARFTQIDYDREVALVAIDEDSANRQYSSGLPESLEIRMERRVNLPFWWGMPGKARALVRSLLEKCLSIAEKQGFKTVHGIVLQANRNMLALGKKLGFEAKRDLDDGDNRLVIHFEGDPIRNHHRASPKKRMIKSFVR